MNTIQVKFVEKKIAYTGEQLRSHWAYRSFDILGDCDAAFRSSTSFMNSGRTSHGPTKATAQT